MSNAKKLAILIGTVSAFFLGIIVAGMLGYRLNNTPSVPLGIYRYTDRADAPYVALCPTGLAQQLSVTRGYRPAGQGCADGHVPMLKPITARPGDVVTVSSRGIYVNHHLLRNSTIYPLDGSKRPMPQLAQRDYAVQPGTFWSISTFNPHSFDSRYFGPISDSEVIHRAVPVLLY